MIILFCLHVGGNANAHVEQGVAFRHRHRRDVLLAGFIVRPEIEFPVSERNPVILRPYAGIFVGNEVAGFLDDFVDFEKSRVFRLVLMVVFWMAVTSL